MQHDPADRVDVLLMLGAYQLRGSYTRALSLMERLPPHRVQLQVVSADPVPLPAACRQRVKLRIFRQIHWPVMGRLTRRFLAADLRAAPPDLIDIQHRGLHPLGAWLARKLQRPYSVTVHDYLRERERLIVDPTWCRRIVAVSESVRSELLDRTRLPEDMVVVIPSGVQPPADSEVSPILEAGRCPVIGTAGPLEAGKGLQHFLRAAVQVLKSHPEAMFVIAGSGPEERLLRRQAAELKLSHALTILPHLRDFNPALKAMDVFVLPALKQGLGAIMLDAMARGLPVIASESGGVFSVVSDEVTGLLVPPSDEGALAERIRYLIEHPARARELGVAARRRVLNQFHVDSMIQVTADLYAGIKREARSASH